jgi:hypothetical protein
MLTLTSEIFVEKILNYASLLWMITDKSQNLKKICVDKNFTLLYTIVIVLYTRQ